MFPRVIHPPSARDICRVSSNSKYSPNHYTPKEIVISVDLYNSTNV
ncbi:hypothetical protein A2U01_0108683, partial [Trifolium medium]|nr:hypothetical protein [Trifolium medium]